MATETVTQYWGHWTRTIEITDSIFLGIAERCKKSASGKVKQLFNNSSDYYIHHYYQKWQFKVYK